ncbi:MAG: hypothetical protein Ta2E_05150 [Mycoplasmoidaceae bacterium]|nr:MAG: hypothetical protein Ta2E_05150 [Mycoplasmoidaceae bacterium]
MAKVIVKGDFNDSMKRFSHVGFETKKDVKKHEYYLRPGLKRVEKSKEALKTNAKARKKQARKA